MLCVPIHLKNVKSFRHFLGDGVMAVSDISDQWQSETHSEYDQKCQALINIQCKKNSF